MVITASQIQWTTNVTKALLTCKERGDNTALKSIKKKQVQQTCTIKLASSDCVDILYICRRSNRLF